MMVKMFLVLNLILQRDTCFVEKMISDTTIVNYQQLIDDDHSRRIQQLFFNQINAGYVEYLQKYHGYILKNFKSDSSILIHRFNNFKIEKSVFINNKKKEIIYFRYMGAEILVCIEKYTHLREFIIKMGSLNKNIENPFLGYVYYENGFATYIINTSFQGIDNLFYVCPYGLSDEHFINDTFNIHPDSEWYLVSEMFNSIPD